MATSFNVFVDSREVVWFKNVLLVEAETKEEAFEKVSSLMEEGGNPYMAFDGEQLECLECVETEEYNIDDYSVADVDIRYPLPINNILNDDLDFTYSYQNILEINKNKLSNEILSCLSNNFASLLGLYSMDDLKKYSDKDNIAWNDFIGFLSQKSLKYIILIE